MATIRSFHPLIIPEELSNGVPFLAVLYIEKSAQGVKYEKLFLSKSMMKHFVMNIQPVLQTFTDDGFFLLLQELRKQHAKSKSGVSQDVFLKRAIFRTLAEKSEILFHELQKDKVYHRTPSPNGGYMTSVCYVSTEKLQLSFEVIEKEDKGLFVVPKYQLGEEIFTYTDAKRHGFLVAIKNTYYILNQQDFIAIEWLIEKKAAQYAEKPNELMQKIIIPLEEKHTIDKKDFFQRNLIEVEPQSMVLLNEISGSFLMITPRWNYDGIIVEGKYQDIYQTHINGELYEVQRNLASEKAFFDYLKNQHPTFARQINGYFYLSFDEAKKKQWFLKTFHQWLADNIEIHGMDMLRHFRYSPFEIHTELNVLEQKGAMMQLEIIVSFGKEKVTLHELKKLLVSGQLYILLRDDSMGVLTEEWIQTYGVIIKHGQIQNDIVTIPQWILLALQQNQTPEQLLPVISKDWWNQWKLWQNEEEQVIAVPSTLKATLRPYQQKGYEWLSLLSEIGAGALLADDMGLGKTLQTIAFLLKLYQEDPSAKFVIVSPASLIYNWYQELLKFTDELKPYIYQSTQRDFQKFLDSGAQVLICSYGTMRSDIDELSIKYWDAVVLDESHSVKNQNTLISKSVQLLSAKNKIALSGTPVMNNTEDLYPQLNFLLPGYLGTNEFFRKEYALPIDRNRDEKKLQALQRMTNPFILRRTKQQVATDLPEKTESVYWCEMGAEQKECYDAIKSSIRNSIFLGIQQDGINKNKLSILQGIQKLRQVCASPVLVKDLDQPTNASVKLDVIMDEITQLGDHKALIFSQFKGMLQIIAQRCQKEGIEYYHIDGDTPVAQRMELVNAFQEEGNSCKVFLISLMTGNAGLNLTAADYVFLVDPWWNTAVQQQAIDRTHRIGQNKNVFAYKMICKDTIEEKILMLQQRKQSLSEDLVHEEDGFVKQLTEEDVAFLFE